MLPEDNDPPESDTSQPESIGLFQAGAGENEQDDQMISDYMQRLLSRDGSSEPSSAAAYQSSSTETESPQTFGSHYKPVDGYGQDKTADQAAKEDKNKEYAPRVRAPELDLSVMRDIANESARSAINRYSFKVWLHAAVVRWSVSIVAFITGVILLYWAQDFSTIAGFSVAQFFLVLAAREFTEVLRRPARAVAA